MPVYVVQLEAQQVTRVQLHTQSVAEGMAFWARSLGYRVRYYRAPSAVRLDRHELSRCLNLMRDYGSLLRFMRRVS